MKRRDYMTGSVFWRDNEYLLSLLKEMKDVMNAGYLLNAIGLVERIDLITRLRMKETL